VRGTKRHIALTGLGERCACLFAGALIVTGVIAFRLFQVQVLAHPQAKQKAKEVWLRRIDLAPARGNLYSRHLRLLATCEPAFSVWADPQTLRSVARRETPLRHLSDEALASRLARVLKEVLTTEQVTVESLRRALNRKVRHRQDGTPIVVRFVWLARQLRASEVQRLQAMLRRKNQALPPEWRVLKQGIGICQEFRRVYPYGRLAASVLGFVNRDGVGCYGVERRWDEVLRGKAGRVEQEVDALGRPIPQGFTALVPSSVGDSLILTLDEQIQQEAEAVLDEAMRLYRPRNAAAIVLDPQTGDVLALASKPDFDPNAYWRFPPERFLNRALSFAYEPGSTFKPIVAAVLLESGAITERTTTECQGVWKGGSFSVRCWVVQQGRAPHGTETLADALCHSCNIAMARFALRLPYARLYRGLIAFGIARKTGVKAGYEEAGWLDPPPSEGWQTPQTRHHQACVAFGQGLMVTPMQLAVAYAAIANDGLLIQPRIVRGIRESETGRVRWLKPCPVGQVISPATAQKIRQMLVAVVEQGTGKRARIEGVTVAGKTGTATKVVKGRYDPTKVVVSFFGMLPADRPKWVIGIVLDEPAFGKWGGEVAAPLFAAFGRRILWRVQPPRPLSLSQHLTAPFFLEPAVSNPLPSASGGKTLSW
jgi:stage V sporulation protein D (sporulation-specific penicillin-binding protein)